jgi:hypothetical protein
MKSAPTAILAKRTNSGNSNKINDQVAVLTTRKVRFGGADPTRRGGGIAGDFEGQFRENARRAREIGQAMLNLLERILIDWNHL